VPGALCVISTSVPICPKPLSVRSSSSQLPTSRLRAP
jgi:hypothetical protein